MTIRSETPNRKASNLALLAAGLHALKLPRFESYVDDLTNRLTSADLASSYDYLVRRAVVTRTVPMLASFAPRLFPEISELVSLSEVSAIAQRQLFDVVCGPVQEVASRNITFGLIKGSDLIHSVYPKSLPRLMADVDLIVQPPDIDEAEQIFLRSGFRQGILDKNNLVFTQMTAEQGDEIRRNHYELPALFKVIHCDDLKDYIPLIEKYFDRDFVLTLGPNVYLMAQADIHFNVSFDIELPDVWHNPRTLSAFGISCHALSFETLVWFYSGRLYSEVLTLDEPGLRLFIDLVAILASAPDLNWDKICSCADKYGINAPLYYSLSRISQFDDRLIPVGIVSHFYSRVMKGSRSSLSRGDFFSRMIEALELAPIEL